MNVTSIQTWPIYDWISFLFGGIGLTTVSAVFYLLRKHWHSDNAALASVETGVSMAISERYPDYYVRTARRQDLQSVRDFIVRQVGDSVAPLPRWYERHAKNPHTVFVVVGAQRRKYSETRELKGVFTIIPLTEDAVNLLASNLLSAVGFTEHHVSGTFESAFGAYISIVLGTDQASRAIVLLALRSKITDLRLTRLPIFTRPVTRDGLRLAERFGFSPVVDTHGFPQQVIHRLG